MEHIQFTKTVHSLAEARDIDLAQWSNQLLEGPGEEENHCIEITVSLYKRKEWKS
jgi:hypothetical protein